MLTSHKGQETMRTTINVDEQLLVQAKAQAATLGVTVAQLIEDALRASPCAASTWSIADVYA